jgi:hypothetical protein
VLRADALVTALFGALSECIQVLILHPSCVSAGTPAYYLLGHFERTIALNLSKMEDFAHNAHVQPTAQTHRFVLTPSGLRQHP